MLVGRIVTATEWVDPDEDRPARTVTGPLEVRHVPGLDYDRWSVNGLGVLPESVHSPGKSAGCLGGDMVDRKTFDLIKEKHGRYASWAVWADSSGSRQSWRAAPSDILDPDRNPTLLCALRNDVVMLALNQSGREIERPFGNFHDYNRHGHDFKIPFAFANTDYWGAYMTDLIKVPELESGNLARRLRAAPSLIDASLSRLREELDDLGGPPPTLIAFGGLTYRLARRHVEAGWYSTLRQVTHYSAWQFSAEKYRSRVRAELGL